MEEKIFDDGDLVILKRNSRYYIQYDAGAHQVAIREDEITENDAALVMQGEDSATKVLFELQKKLEQSGADPYVSNIEVG